jgi:hypothetical protein
VVVKVKVMKVIPAAGSQILAARLSISLCWHRTVDDRLL